MKVYFRSDGDSRIGLGHMIRSAALASFLKGNFECILLTKCKLKDVLTEVKLIYKEVIRLQDDDHKTEIQQLSELISRESLLVLDGYHFDAPYQKALWENGIQIFCIDDIHANKFYADTIINSSGGVSPIDYDALPSTQFLLGPRYALLRKPFLEATKKRRENVDNEACFICFGGADPDSQTIKLLKEPSIRHRFKKFHVVIGSAFLAQKELRALVDAANNIILHQSLSAESMVEVMKQCAYAICSPSTIVYEYMCCGGIIFLKQTADNQKDLMDFVTSEKLAFNIAEMAQVTEAKKQEVLARQNQFFDGQSGERLLRIFQQFFDGNKLSIRKAHIKDIETIFSWANDPEVRAQSYSTEQISMTNHSIWLQKKLDDPDSFYYILEFKQQPVAQIRFQVKDGEAVLGYLADKAIRSRGLGTEILRKGIASLLQDINQSITITGYVKESNIPSQRSFERLAFKKEISKEYPYSFKYTMNYEN